MIVVSNYSLVISVSQATLHPRTFSNPRNGKIGLPLTQNSVKYSDGVCNPCGRKIRNLGQLYQFVKKAATATSSTPVKRSKITLDTPEKASLQWRKSPGSRKSLAFAGKNIQNTSPCLERENEMLSKLNVENLPSDGVKILYLNQSGNVTVRILEILKLKRVKNIAARNGEKFQMVS